jgi:HipA-like protein
MRQGMVYYNDIVAGIIKETGNGSYEFNYDDNYFSNSSLPAISVTIAKSKKQHSSRNLFPFFFNMLSEGTNRKTQCRILKIDEQDDFGLLLKTGANETIGAITVEEINET